MLPYAVVSALLGVVIVARQHRPERPAKGRRIPKLRLLTQTWTQRDTIA